MTSTMNKLFLVSAALASTTSAFVSRGSPPASACPPTKSMRLYGTTYAAAGAPAVDMSRYDLSLEEAVEDWTAVASAGTAMQEAGVYLRSRSKENFVDTEKFTIKRDGGLGLLLTEIAGGREDGVGITVVEEVLEGSNAEGSGIVPGDSIVAVSVSRTTESGPRTVEEDRLDVATECLGYDATIEALMSLPPVNSPDDELTLTIKRIRRQPRVNVKLQYPPYSEEEDQTIELFAGENLRRAMLTRGIKLNDKFAQRFDSGGSGDCGSDGTCATCVVAVSSGQDLLSPAGQQEKQILAKKPRWRMACKAVVGYGIREGEMTVQVSPRQWEE